MVAKEISVKKYVVRLNADERERLEVLIRKGKSPAQRLLKARILLKADVSQAGEGWSDSRIIKALETGPSMVYRVRKQLVEEGFEAVLSRKQRATPAVARIFDGIGRLVPLPLLPTSPDPRKSAPIGATKSSAPPSSTIGTTSGAQPDRTSEGRLSQPDASHSLKVVGPRPYGSLWLLWAGQLTRF